MSILVRLVGPRNAERMRIWSVSFVCYLTSAVGIGYFVIKPTKDAAKIMNQMNLEDKNQQDKKLNK